MGLCWDELHTPDPESLIKSWHGKKSSLSAFTTAKLWDSAMPAIILLSPASVSYHCYQNQKCRGISNRKEFWPCAPSLDGVPVCVPLSSPAARSQARGARVCGGTGGQPPRLLRVGAFQGNPNQSLSHTWANSEHLVFLSVTSFPSLPSPKDKMI